MVNKSRSPDGSIPCSSCGLIFWEVGATGRELLAASQAGYRLPLSLRCLNQFRALNRPADRVDLDCEAKVLPLTG